jgi:hypothetical protein
VKVTGAGLGGLGCGWAGLLLWQIAYWSSSSRISTSSRALPPLLPEEVQQPPRCCAKRRAPAAAPLSSRVGAGPGRGARLRLHHTH